MGRRGIFAAIVDDLKADVQAVKDLIWRLKHGQGFLTEGRKQELQEELRQFSLYDYVRENIIELVVYILMFIIGMRWGYWLAIRRSNKFIADHFVENVTTNLIPAVINFSTDIVSGIIRIIL